MASAGSPLGAFINVRKGQEHDPRGLTLGDLMQMTPHEALMRGLEIAGEDLAALDAGQPALRPAREVSDPWGARITADAQAQREGAVRALQNAPYSPLAAGVELAAPAAYDALTREVPGANPEAPNVLAAVDNLSLGGLIEAPVARSLLRTRPPGARETAPARLRGMPRGGEETAAPFYSQARTVVEDPKTQGTQTGEAWLKFMQDPKRGVKAEELEFTRLGDFLRERSGKRVTRDEILGHLDLNEIEVKEVTKGVKPVIPEAEALKKRNAELSEQLAPLRAEWMRLADMVPLDEKGLYIDTTPEYAAMEAAREPMKTLIKEQDANEREIRRMSDEREYASKTKFSKYTLPGAENYREVLLTIPNPAEKLDARRKEIESIGSAATPEQRQEWADIMNRLRPDTRDYEGNVRFRGAPDFRSSHWDEPNVLAHLRLSDRDMDGKRTLLVEEIQSDWAQKGRREGFSTPETELPEGWSVVPHEGGEGWGNLKGFVVQDAKGQTIAVGESRDAAIANARQSDFGGQMADLMRIPRKGDARVPQAPFVTDTSKWTALSLKRVLKMAADEGYDRVAIVPGAEQAKRYDLSKQVDEITWYNPQGRVSYPVGVREVTIEMPGSSGISVSIDTSGRVLSSTHQRFEGKTLDEVVGKDVADKIMSDESGSLSGEGIQVGGEGMKGYYDKIVPDALNKLAKEYGVKVQLEGGKVGDPKVRSLDQINAEMDAVVNELGDRDWSEREDLFRRHQALQKEYNRAKEGAGEVPVHTLEVPPEMREKIKKKGFPLYSSLTLGDMMGAQNA